MRFLKGLIAAGVLAAMSATGAQASSINGATSGIAMPEQVIDFSEVPGLVTGDTVTTQYQALGATFSPQLTFFSTVSARGNFSGPALLSFDNPPFEIFDPFSINFTSPVSEASFAMTTNNGMTTFTALLNGAFVESFVGNTNTGTANNNIYGFTNLVFDEIQVDASVPPGAIDNLAFTTAAVPVPAMAPLFALSLLGVAAIARRRRAAA